MQPADVAVLISKGSTALNIELSSRMIIRLVEDCYENTGILQALVLKTLVEVGLAEEQEDLSHIDDLDSAEMSYADQLNPLYRVFADRVSFGIRQRKRRQESTHTPWLLCSKPMIQNLQLGYT